MLEGYDHGGGGRQGGSDAVHPRPVSEASHTVLLLLGRLDMESSLLRIKY